MAEQQDYPPTQSGSTGPAEELLETCRMWLDFRTRADPDEFRDLLFRAAGQAGLSDFAAGSSCLTFAQLWDLFADGGDISLIGDDAGSDCPADLATMVASLEEYLAQGIAEAADGFQFSDGFFWTVDWGTVLDASGQAHPASSFAAGRIWKQDSGAWFFQEAGSTVWTAFPDAEQPAPTAGTLGEGSDQDEWPAQSPDEARQQELSGFLEEVLREVPQARDLPREDVLRAIVHGLRPGEAPQGETRGT